MDKWWVGPSELWIGWTSGCDLDLMKCELCVIFGWLDWFVCIFGEFWIVPRKYVSGHFGKVPLKLFGGTLAKCP